jgi:hypothetical protein
MAVQVTVNVGQTAERLARLYCGDHTLPEGAVIVGTVAGVGVGSGALVFLQPGTYVWMNQGVIQQIDLRAVHEALEEACGAAGKET